MSDTEEDYGWGEEEDFKDDPKVVRIATAYPRMGVKFVYPENHVEDEEET